MRRDDPDNKTFFRSTQRVFRMNESWYFSAREGDQGPWGSELDAKRECERFTEEKTGLAHFQEVRELESKQTRVLPKLAALPLSKRDQVQLTPYSSDSVESLAVLS